jgi:hypothetical protein
MSLIESFALVSNISLYLNQRQAVIVMAVLVVQAVLMSDDMDDDPL